MQPDHEVTPQDGSVYSWSGLPCDGHHRDDFPLTGVCTCGRHLRRDNPSSPWRHRADDEPPITESTSGGWLTMLTAVTAEGQHGHAITPVVGSVVRERDGQPADLLHVTSYPVLATCQECGGTVRCQRKILADWTHVPSVPAQRLACSSCGSGGSRELDACNG